MRHVPLWVVAALLLWSIVSGSMQENRRITQLEMALAQAHAHADSLEAVPDLAPYVGDLCVRVDRLEALAGIGGD